jgi:dihydrodipicolinate reductase
MRILIVGHGRMGQLIERLAPEHGCEVAGIVTRAAGSSVRGDFGPVDVAIDFTLPRPCRYFEALAERG